MLAALPGRKQAAHVGRIGGQASSSIQPSLRLVRHCKPPPSVPPGPCPQRLACVQHTVEQCWSHSFRGRINGVEFDFQGYKAHWEALQASGGFSSNLMALGICPWAVVLHRGDSIAQVGIAARRPACTHPPPPTALTLRRTR